MKDLLKFIVDELVSNKEAVQITEEVNGNNIDFSVTVDPEDLGAVIGRGGRVANSIRAVVRASAKKENKRVNIKFN